MSRTESQRLAEREAKRAGLRAEIRSCERKIDELNGEIERISRKIEEQQEAEKKYANMRVETERIKGEKRIKMRDVSGYEKNIKFLGGYAGRICDFLDGQRAGNSRAYMEDVTARMWKEINVNEQRVVELRREAALYREKAAVLWSQLRGI